MADLTYEERKALRRAAEDARDACNRHYGPFVDLVAHPLNILALLDMADRAALAQQPCGQDREDAAVLTSEFSKGYELGLRQRTSQDREDAERYRWLRERRNGDGPAAAVRCIDGPYFNREVYGDHLDAAIDAARAAAKERT
jgi:hypothetical protein